MKQSFLVFNPFSTNVPLLHPLKTSENQTFSDFFRRYRSGTLVENGLSKQNFLPMKASSRSSYRRCSIKKGVLKNFAKFTGKHRLWHKHFPVNLSKLLRTPFLQNTSGGCFCIVSFCSKYHSVSLRFFLVWESRPHEILFIYLF